MNDLQRQREDFAKEVASIVQAMKRLMERADELDLNVVFSIDKDDSRQFKKRWISRYEILTKPHIETIAKG